MSTENFNETKVDGQVYTNGGGIAQKEFNALIKFINPWEARIKDSLWKYSGNDFQLYTKSILILAQSLVSYILSLANDESKVDIINAFRKVLDLLEVEHNLK